MTPPPFSPPPIAQAAGGPPPPAPGVCVCVCVCARARAHVCLCRVCDLFPFFTKTQEAVQVPADHEHPAGPAPEAIPAGPAPEAIHVYTSAGPTAGPRRGGLVWGQPDHERTRTRGGMSVSRAGAHGHGPEERFNLPLKSIVWGQPGAPRGPWRGRRQPAGGRAEEVVGGRRPKKKAEEVVG